MERRKASPEQLNMLLHFLEEDKELAIGKFTGIEGKVRQTNAWIKITEKLNGNSGFGSGAIKTPDKWQQTWRDWKSNVKKKAFKIRKNRYASVCNTNIQLTDAEEKILKLICNNTSVFGIAGVPETDAPVTDSMSQIQSNEINANDQSSSTMKWPPGPHNFPDMDLGLEEAVATECDAGMGPNEVSSAPAMEKTQWKRGRSTKLVHERLLSLEEERIKVMKQKLLEKKRCNNIRLKLEKERLEIERQRNVLLEKLLVAVEAVVHR